MLVVVIRGISAKQSRGRKKERTASVKGEAEKGWRGGVEVAVLLCIWGRARA